FDAYSPHLAYTDSIHQLKSRSFKSIGLTYIRAGMTFAGVHSAVSRAFNRLKAQASKEGKEYRAPTLVLYEGAYSLTDLESPEQYRVFLRHVIPSERLWEG